jgi:RimJ/RimL family protein N-acetyltransferase
MIDPAHFRDQVTLTTANLVLEPLGLEHFAGVWVTVNDPEARRLTGIHDVYTEDQVRAYLVARKDQHDRADWAIVRASDRAHIGVVVLNDLDRHNESMNFRITLSNEASVTGKGYGSEATRAVVEYGISVVGLHRITLEVADFNTRAQRVYGKAGFSPEGLAREAWYWDGERSDIIRMAIVNDR